MKCMDCPLKYRVEGKMFYTRDKDRVQAVRNNDGNSGYSIHIPIKDGGITDTTIVLKSRKNNMSGCTIVLPYI
jgi:hypothetical protein